MNAYESRLLTSLQRFLRTQVLQDSTVPFLHESALLFCAEISLLLDRQRPALAHFLVWKVSAENTVRDNPKGEMLAYSALFPGRVTDLLLELTS